MSTQDVSRVNLHHVAYRAAKAIKAKVEGAVEVPFEYKANITSQYVHFEPDREEEAIAALAERVMAVGLKQFMAPPDLQAWPGWSEPEWCTAKGNGVAVRVVRQHDVMSNREIHRIDVIGTP